MIDPDDLILNQYLFEELYTYNKKYNLDIIEFLVYHQKEGKNNIIIPKKQHLNHYHNFKKQIIKQPELSEILFHKPNSNEYIVYKFNFMHILFGDRVQLSVELFGIK